MRTAAASVHLIAATVGFLSFALLWAAVVWGLVLRNGWAMTRMRHSTVYGIHQVVALLGLTLGAVHAFAQLASPTTFVRLVDTVIPFLNPVDTVGLGLGVVALEVMTAAAVTTLLQRKMGYSRWRGLHALTYAAFMLLVGHVLISGSDVGPPYVWGTILVAWLVTVALWVTTTPAVTLLRHRARQRTAGRQRGREISVDVDARKCARFGFCEHEAPEVFHLRSDGRLAYRASVPDTDAEALIRAAEVCPARAIVLNRMASTVMTAAPEDSGPQLVEPTEPTPVAPAAPATNGSRPQRETVTELYRRGGRR